LGTRDTESVLSLSKKKNGEEKKIKDDTKKRMNKIIQILGLIFNIYLVFLLISKNKGMVTNNKNTIIETNKVSTFSWLQHTSQDSNRLKILNRIGIL